MQTPLATLIFLFVVGEHAQSHWWSFSGTFPASTQPLLRVIPNPTLLQLQPKTQFPSQSQQKPNTTGNPNPNPDPNPNPNPNLQTNGTFQNCQGSQCNQNNVNTDITNISNVKNVTNVFGQPVTDTQPSDRTTCHNCSFKFFFLAKSGVVGI